MNIDKNCTCACDCESVVSVPICQSGGKIWCGECWAQHSTPEEHTRVSWARGSIEEGLIRPVSPPGLVNTPIVSVRPMPRGWRNLRPSDQIDSD